MSPGAAAAVRPNGPAPGAPEAWGCGDWRSGAGYPDPAAGDHVWRWEFLRRRWWFRAAWLAQVGGPPLSADDRAMFRALVRRHGLDLAAVPDPARPTLPRHWWLAEVLPVDRQWSPAFDLSQPTGSQIKAVLAELAWRQAWAFPDVAAGRRHRERWDLALRTLDARDACVSWTVIGRALQSSGAAWAREQLERAEKISARLASDEVEDVRRGVLARAGRAGPLPKETGGRKRGA